MEDGPPQWRAESLYELVPLFDLPEVDLSTSIRSHYVHHRALHRIIRVMSASVFTFAGFLLYLACSVAVFLVPAPIGRLLAVVGVVSGVSAAVLSIGNLRLDMVLVLIKTYDIWFFTAVSTLVSVLLGLLLRDSRSMLVAMSWLSFLTNIFIDASIVGKRRVWIANVISVGCYLLMAATVSGNITEELVAFDIVQFNGHAVPAVGVFRDGVTSMVVVILRNLYRKAGEVSKSTRVATDDGSFMVECVSFRCRLRVRSADTSSVPVSVLPSIASCIREVGVSSASKKTRLQFRSFLEPMDPRSTFLPVHPLLLVIAARQQFFRCLGIAGFVALQLVVLSVLMVPMLMHSREVEILCSVGMACSVAFVSTCLAATQRHLACAVITSFDSVFIAAQSAIGFLSLLDLFRWEPILVMGLVGHSMWVLWLLSWDALLPPTRSALGLTPRLAACVGTGIGITMILAAITALVLRSPHEINDRAVWKAHVARHQIEFRPLSWFAGSLATTMAWGIRLNWRLWQATGTELVVLDGPVVYKAGKARVRPERVASAE